MNKALFKYDANKTRYTVLYWVDNGNGMGMGRSEVLFTNEIKDVFDFMMEKRAEYNGCHIDFSVYEGWSDSQTKIL